MLTPQQNLEEAARLLDAATKLFSDDVEKGNFVSVEDITRIVNSRIALAQALHMVRLAENVNDVLEENRPRRYGLADIEP